MSDTVLLKDADEAFRSSDSSDDFEYFQQLFRKGPVVVIRWRNEPGWPVSYVSNNIQSLLGYTPDELYSAGMVHSDIIHPDDLERVEKEVKQATDNNILEFDHEPYRVFHKDGSFRWIRDRTVTILDSNKNITGYLGYIFDITSQQINTNVSKLIDDLTTEIIDTTPAVIFAKDVTGRYFFVNKQYELLMNVVKEDIVGKFDQDYYPDDVVKKLRENDLWVINHKKTLEVEEIIPIPGQELVYLSCKFPLFDDDNNVIAVCGIATDITERKRNSDELIRNENLLKEAHRLAKLGHWHLDIATDHLEWSDEVFVICEIDKDTAESTYDAFYKRVHPDDRELVLNTFNQSIEKRKPYTLIHRLLMDDGRIKYVHERCTTEFDDKGNPLTSTGTVQDITEYKLSEITLHKALNLLDTSYTERAKDLSTLSKRIEEGVSEQKRVKKELIYQAEILEVISELSKEFLEVKSWEVIIDNALCKFGKIIHADNIYIYKNELDKSQSFANLKHHCYSGCSISDMGSSPQRTIYWDDLIEFKVLEQLSSGNILFANDNENAGIFNCLAIRESVQSAVWAPIQLNGIFWGFIGIEQTKLSPIWSSIEQNALVSFAGLISASLSNLVAERKLESERLNVARLLNHIPSLICIKNADGQWVDANQTLVALFGLDLVDFIGKTTKEIVALGHADIEQLLLTCDQYENKAIQLASDVEFELSIPVDDSHKLFSVSVLPVFNHQDKLEAVISIGHDISRQKEAHEERIKSLSEYTDSLVREVHHRIKNHLQGIVSLIKHNAVDNKSLIDYQTDIIRQIQSIAMVYGIQSQSDSESIEISRLLEAIVGDISLITHSTIDLEKCGCTVCLKIPGNKAVSVSLIVNELIINSIKHSNQNAPNSTVRIKHTEFSNNSIIRVENDGILPDDFNFKTGAGCNTGLELIKAMIPSNGFTLEIFQEENRVISEIIMSPPVLLRDT